MAKHKCFIVCGLLAGGLLVAAGGYLVWEDAAAEKRVRELRLAFRVMDAEIDESLEEVRRIRDARTFAEDEKARQDYWTLYARAGVEKRDVPAILEEASLKDLPATELLNLGRAWRRRYTDPLYRYRKRMLDDPRIFTRQWVAEYQTFRDGWPQPYEIWKGRYYPFTLPDDPDVRTLYAGYLKIDPRPDNKRRR